MSHLSDLLRRCREELEVDPGRLASAARVQVRHAQIGLSALLLGESLRLIVVVEALVVVQVTIEFGLGLLRTRRRTRLRLRIPLAT